MHIDFISNVPDAPKALGPYSLGIVAEGKFLYISGQTPFDPEKGCIVRGSVEEQTELVLRNIERIVKAAGGNIGNIVKCTVYLQQLTETNFKAMNGVYEKFFGTHKPTRTTIGCQLLNMDVEIDAIAVL